jgi:hypothetical protein
VLRRVPTPPPPRPQYLHELRICLQDACVSVEMQMLSSVWNEIDYSFDRITSGAIITLKVLVYAQKISLKCMNIYNHP